MAKTAAVVVLLIYSVVIFDLLHAWYESIRVKSDLEKRGLVLEDGVVRRLQ
jgi:hypothetical protein